MAIFVIDEFSKHCKIELFSELFTFFKSQIFAVENFHSGNLIWVRIFIRAVAIFIRRNAFLKNQLTIEMMGVFSIYCIELLIFVNFA